jgi:ATP-binding cassette subfamily F protein 3
MTLVRLQHISKAFAGNPILQDISWQIEAGQKIGLIGANGSGKSTLLQILSGTMPSDSGVVERSRGLRLGHLTQIMTVEGDRTLYEEVREAFRHLLDIQQEMVGLESRMGANEASAQEMQHYGTLLETFNAAQGYAIQSRVEATLFGLGFGPSDLHKPVAQLSGGQKNMGALARVLLQAPELLLLDEPSNHLDIVATEWLEGFLRDYSGTVVVVSHDRYFLDRVVDEIVALEGHGLRRYPGNYSAYVVAKAARLEQQRKAYEQQQAEIRRQEDFIRRHIAGQKTRQAQSRQKALERMQRLEQPVADKRRIQLKMDAGRRESHEVVVCRKVWKSFGDHTVLRDLSCTVYRGDKVGLMGPNGAGKSTLLRLLLARDTVDEGVLRLGHHITAAYYDQELHDLNPERTVLDEVWQVEPWKTVGEIRGYLGRFLFSGDEVLKAVGSLSGGEKSRLALAKLMLSPANLLILDEPTNHLDIPAREALEQALSEYPGTLILVSHDRYFVDRVVSRLLYIKDGRCEAYPGNYSAYQAHLAAQRVATATVNPRSRPQAKQSESRRRSRSVRHRKIGVIEQDISEIEAQLAELQVAIESHQETGDWQQLVDLTTQQGVVAERLEMLMQEWEDAMAAEERA